MVDYFIATMRCSKSFEEILRVNTQFSDNYETSCPLVVFFKQRADNTFKYLRTHLSVYQVPIKFTANWQMFTFAVAVLS